jgi:low temperature requirement protein LtrA
MHATAIHAPGDQEKRVTWVELFFDLVFVVAITQVTSLLHADHSWSGAAHALVVFVPTYWAWVGMTMHANLHDVDRVRARSRESEATRQTGRTYRCSTHGWVVPG